MSKILSAEDLLNYIVDSNNGIRLSRYDKKFFDSIHLLANNGSPITQNQDRLFNTLLLKYRRQFHNKNLSIDEVSNLPWHNTRIIASEPLFTDAFIEINNDEIIFRSPYKIKFIEDLRQEDYFTWNKLEKKYSGKYSTTALKHLHDNAMMHFEKVNYCAITTKLLKEIDQYNTIKFWQPTLVKVNDNLIIAAHNDILDEHIKDFVIDYSLSSFARLVYYGVHIDTSVIAEANTQIELDHLKFATNRNPTFEINQPKLLSNLLKNVGCDFVLIFNFRMNDLHNEIVEYLIKNKIQYTCISTEDDVKKFKTINGKTLTETLRNAVLPIQLSFKRFSMFEYSTVAKTVSMVDSRPIETK